MTTVGVRELKANLSAYLRKVRAGEAVRVTDRGQAIAEIVPAGWVSTQPVPPAWEEMIRQGRVRPAISSGPIQFTPLNPPLPDGTAQRWLDEERGER